MVNTASSVSNRHYREACTRCSDKDKEISRLNAEIMKLTVAKSLSVSVRGKETEKLILGKLPQQVSASSSPRRRPEPIDIVYGLCLAFAIAFVWITFAHGMATGNRLIQTLSALSAPIIGIYLAIKFGGDKP